MRMSGQKAYEFESTNRFQKCGSKDCNPSIFYEMRKQKLRGFT